MFLTPTQWATLLAAIVCETVATSALARSEQFSLLLPSIVTVLGYAASFWLLSVTLRAAPVGVVYAIWSGVGVVLVTLIGRFVFGQRLDGAAIAGIGLIVAGVMVINLFSKANPH